MSKHNRKDHWKIRNFQNFAEFSLSHYQEMREYLNFVDLESLFYGLKWPTRWVTVKYWVHERVQKW